MELLASVVGGICGGVVTTLYLQRERAAAIKRHPSTREEERELQSYARLLEDAAFKHHSSHRPKRLIFFRHGQSQGNVHEEAYSTIPDHAMPLTPLGHKQAAEAGKKLREFISDESAFFFVSPYRRAQETMRGIMEGGGFPATHTDGSALFMEDTNLREQEFGNFQDPASMEKDKKIRKHFGRFWFRFPNGESGADVYLRVTLFLGTLFRWMDSPNKPKFDNYVLVTHGLTIRLLLMRYFRWTIQDFEQVWNPENCDMWVLEKKEDSGEYELVSTDDIRWGDPKGPLPQEMCVCRHQRSHDEEPVEAASPSHNLSALFHPHGFGLGSHP